MATSFAGRLARVASATGVLCVVPSAFALTYDVGDLQIRFDTRLTESLAMRTESPSSSIVGIGNGGNAYSTNADDGDLAFKKNSLFAATTRITPSLNLTWNSFGLVASANYSWDPRVEGHGVLDKDDFGAGHQYSQDVRRHSEQVTDDQVGHKFALLDLYAFDTWKVLGHALTVKVGQQNVQWGESFLVFNGLNSIQAYDANKANTTSFEIDEVQRPVPQVFASVDLWSGYSLDGWYQLQWKPTKVPYAGTFFSVNDYVATNGIGGNIDFGRAGEYVNAGSECRDPNQFPAGVTFPCVPFGGSIPRGRNNNAKDSGQFGFALNGAIEALDNLVYSLYAANYHSRLPLFSTLSAASGNPDAGTARILGEYPENIHMFGASFNASAPFGIAVQGEYSYKPNQPLEIDDVEQSLADLGAPSQIDETAGQTLGNQYIRGWRRHEVSLWDVSATKLLAPNGTLGYSELLVLAEFGFVRVHDLESNSDLRYEAPGTFLPGGAESAATLGLPQQKGGFATTNSCGMNLVVRATWNNVLPNIQLTPSVRWSQGIHGTTPAPLQNFVEHTKLVTPGVQFLYGHDTTVDVAYSRYFGGGDFNLLKDRDFVSMDLKYSF